MSHPVLSIQGVTKQYGALRPLRIEQLDVEPGQHIAIVGLDQPAAEVFINLVTGGGLPDTGSVIVNGRSTADIADSTDWLSTLDQFGIVSDRAPLIEPLSVIQNLAMPFTLDIEPPEPDVADKAAALARDVGLPESSWHRPVHELDANGHVRIRLARALALGPALLLLEHPSATLERGDVVAFGRDVRAIVSPRGATAITLTMDRDLAGTIAAKTLTLDPVSGRLKEGWLARMGFRS